MSGKRNILIYLAVLLVVFIGIFIWGGWYNDWRKVTTEVLVKNAWEVEGNGTYNHLSFSADQTFKASAYPEEVATGKWIFDGSKLELDFNSEIPNRIYTGFEFGRDSALYSLTDENRERWVAVTK